MRKIKNKEIEVSWIVSEEVPLSVLISDLRLRIVLLSFLIVWFLSRIKSLRELISL